MIPHSTLAKPKKADQRRQAFVDTAREAFFTSGYGGTSMSAISAKVGGSKTTLWTYFPSKQELFAAVVDDLVERYGRALEVELDPEGEVTAELCRFAMALLETFHSGPIIDMHRLLFAEAGRFPELAAMMYARGPARGKARLRDFFDKAMQRGKLRDGDASVASELFPALLQFGSAQKHLLGLTGRPSDEELAYEAGQAVETFLRGWHA
jgi:TetR/AcrR family transcriptional regulator, mexJK operon transcriptional repressor